GGPVGPKMRRDDLAKKLGRPPTEMEYQLRNWYNFVWTCGDHICEQHIHNLDVINWIKNVYPASCHGLGGRAYLNQPDHGEIFDHHAVEYQYADGTIMFSQCRQIPGCNNDVSESVTGSKGSWASKGNPAYAIRDLKGDVQWRYKGPDGESNDGHQLEHFPLMKAIRENKPFNEAERGAYSSLTAVMGRMATYSGKIVTWEQALNSKLDQMPEKFDLKANPRTMPNADGSYNFPLPGKTVAL
ncbi:MAG: dehydrogenase, partial [Verrucomicrobia bacterium]|nr:dehydrogenase [Verrucomicrobiota bacterium]